MQHEQNDFKALQAELTLLLEQHQGHQLLIKSVNSDFSVPVRSVERDRFDRVWVRGTRSTGTVVSVLWSPNYYFEVDTGIRAMNPVFVDRTVGAEDRAINAAIGR